ncbi:RNA-directed DNA polymerase, eukaryota [Tanacetum coccineum]|uniref:RNA-directed DNA polymerase, eukaryota n=1 Tax=Tanacetum coccineum TaxID=301880 RepID=A0ABQ4XVY1_9ASTR
MIFMRYIWFKLQANIARFHRPPVNGNNLHEKKIVGTTNSNLHRNEGVNSKSFASALNSHAPVHTKLDIPSPAMFGFPNVNVTYMGGMWVLLTFDDEGTKEKLLNHKGVNSWFFVINPYSDLFVCDERVIWVSIEGLPPKAMTQTLPLARIVLKLGWWFCELHVNEEILEEGEVNHVSESSFMQENNSDHPKQPSINVLDPSSQDPFGIYKILNRNHVEKSPSNGDPKFPPGFTPDVVSEHVTGEVEAQKHTAEGISQPQKTYVDTNDGVSSSLNGNNFSKHIKTGGSILEVMDELVKIGQTMGYNMEGCLKNISSRLENWLAREFFETKSNNINLFDIKAIWGNYSFEFATSDAIGYSGGISCIWDPNVFSKDNVTASDSFLAIRGTWLLTSSKLLIISVYAPQDPVEKRMLWGFICVTSNKDGRCAAVMSHEDFNEVRSEHERFGTLFNANAAKAFNTFIAQANLIDLPLEGYSFTWSHTSASKMSKLDRFLVSEGLHSMFPSLSALCLEKNLSDHRPILMRELNSDYGPTPFRIFHSWFSLEGFDNLVRESWSKPVHDEKNSMDRLKKKFQNLKANIKTWRKKGNRSIYDTKSSIQNELSNLDKTIDQGMCQEETLAERTKLQHRLYDLNSLISQDMAQKAKIRWAIEGDENSKFFHGMINKKRSQLAIRGVLVDGEWISETTKVRNEFLSHFSNRFSAPPSPRLRLESQFDKVLSQEQNDDLERPISKDEIKCAVWDCGTNKSPGPDGFTFEFIRKYWSIISVDIEDVVSHFFNTDTFSQGCNSSFIALIPKTQDAKLVKDFRPISLIGCIYKIVTKVLANRLCIIIPYLISDVQSAFVTNRQILDGPFILSELLSWCKQKKFQSLIFKVDFEKAFDSIRWDYLDEVLLNFGFGSKWRGWIKGCLSSSLGSVLVNGCPTTEFKFYKGLKQGDPLSPFLFILVMESLHLAFSKVINAGFFKGINLNESLTLSHFFYADDAVFVGKWEVSNISAIVNVLNIFHMASGLKINIQKSKLMGVGVSKEEVESAARYVGCSTFSTPFTYLGITVGKNMAKISSWDDHINKLSARLSKWKSKLLSIGGRFTLIKSVLSSIPLYHMSLFKYLWVVGFKQHWNNPKEFFLMVSTMNDRKITLVFG